MQPSGEQLIVVPGGTSITDIPDAAGGALRSVQHSVPHVRVADAGL